jgi:outer membrane protein assembly factor BamE
MPSALILTRRKGKLVLSAHMTLLTSLFVLATVLVGCDLEHRRLMKEQYPSYPEGVRRAIDRGNILRGMDQEQVYLALGSPVCKTEIEDEGRPLQVWLYPPIGRDACVTAHFRVYFEEGRVTAWDRFTKPSRYTDPPGGAP